MPARYLLTSVGDPSVLWVTFSRALTVFSVETFSLLMGTWSVQLDLHVRF